MQVYGGSWNASRIAGEFVYPVFRYNKAPVEAVSPLSRRPIDLERSQVVNQNELDYPQANQSRTIASGVERESEYAMSPFKLRAPSEKGLFLNILG